MASLFLLQGSEALIAIYSAYNLFLTTQSIRQLGQYENMSKKAAKVSNAAANELASTRTTMAGAAIAVSVSTLTSSVLLWFQPALPWVAFSSLFGGILYAVKWDFGNYWGKKATVSELVPGVEVYNEALGRNKGLVGNLGLLAGGWAVLEVLTCAVMWTR